VNVGQAAEIFPSASTAFLKGQGHGAFQLPSSLLPAASFGTAALFLVEDIEGGYFDKLRGSPVPRWLILEDLAWSAIAPGFAVLGAIVLSLNVRMIKHCD
jgi:ABC-2 type transport system permease protein